MKKAIVKWPISTLSIGAFILFIGILIAFNWFFVFAYPESTYLGAIVALIGIGIIIFAVVKRPSEKTSTV